MKTRTSLRPFLMLFFIFSITACMSKKKEEAYISKKDGTTTETSETDLIKKGEYLVKIIGCDHCHTPKKMTDQGPVPDMDRWLMGHPANATVPEIPENVVGPGKWILMNNDLTVAVGPWGTSFGANLTPDDTGIGSWSYEQFKRAMTEGKFKGMENSRPLMPPMPWQSYKEMKDEDLRAMYMYLMSIKPIENVVPSYIPPSEIQ
ncbi:diheme cytochrome c-553 [Altibacter sp.]|uniref:diheme cytochrome c-553 n=1 Tax=Altibacter sp. TaxID=2024823 RepID=UPI0025C5AD16|nr:diheme cytochrome c-553 [Altibacter sp.]